MKNKLFLMVALVLTGVMLITACENEGEAKNSNEGDDSSHNAGRNCLGCHRKGGSGSGIFYVGGTVYDSLRTAVNSGCTVKITTEPNGAGTELVSLLTDEKGNFYTTETVDFSVPRYVSIVGKTGNRKFMESSITNGACSSCHGSTQIKAWVN